LITELFPDFINDIARRLFILIFDLGCRGLNLDLFFPVVILHTIRPFDTTNIMESDVFSLMPSYFLNVAQERIRLSVDMNTDIIMAVSPHKNRYPNRCHILRESHCPEQSRQ